MKIVGQLVCGPGEADKYLGETLREFRRLCDTAVVATCNAGDKEKMLIASFGFRQYEDNRTWGIDQPNIKTDLLNEIIAEGADWIVVLDADETLPTVDRETLEDMTEGRESCQFYVVNLWNDEQHYKKSAAFWNVRFYKADASKGTQFLRKPVHCGNAPPYFYSLPAKKTYVPHLMLHKGLMNPAHRKSKVVRYQQFDPHAIHKGREYYEMLEMDEGCAEYDQDAVVLKIQEYCKQIGA